MEMFYLRLLKYGGVEKEPPLRRLWSPTQLEDSSIQLDSSIRLDDTTWRYDKAPRPTIRHNDLTIQPDDTTRWVVDTTRWVDWTIRSDGTTRHLDQRYGTMIWPFNRTKRWHDLSTRRYDRMTWRFDLSTRRYDRMTWHLDFDTDLTS